MASKAKKLYFDLTGALAVTAGDSQIIKLTEETETTPTDRFGNLLAEVPAATSVTPVQVRQRNEVTAIFMPRTSGAVPVASTITVQFVDSSNNLSPAVGTAPAGASAVGLQNPCAKVTFIGGSGSVSGVLYIQRQHSIEA
jgi:hypothetical protein